MEIIYNRKHFSFESKVSSIINASKSSESSNVIKYGNLFLNTQKDGNISLCGNAGGGESRALGLFTGDMQFISRYDLDVYCNCDKLNHKTIHSENDGYSSCHENIYEDFLKIKSERLINGAFFEKIDLEVEVSRQLKSNFLFQALLKIFLRLGVRFTPNQERQM